MLDEQSLRRLEEMGIDVYAPRGARRSGEVAQVVLSPRKDALAAPTGSVRARVLLLARAEQARAKTLLANIVRALAFARIDGVIESAIDEARLGDAAGLVVFGDALVRQAGAALSEDRSRKLQWVAAADIGGSAMDAAAKRALWSELRRVIRGVAKGVDLGSRGS
jgi:hypothetical protein